MSKFFQNRFFLLLALIFVIGCTNVDNFFGNEFIPPSQDMDTYIDSSMRVRTSIIKMDSMFGNLSGVGNLGSRIDPMTGRMTLGFFSTYVPVAFENHDSLFGVNPVLDSMKLRVSFAYRVGDTTQDVHVSMYEVQDSVFNYKRVYYMGMNPELYYNSSEQPLAKFVMRGQPSIDVDLPRSFFEKFMANSPLNEEDKKTNMYYNDSIFISKFKGFYFRTTPVTSGKGQIATIDLAQGKTTLYLFYHNFNPKKYDTMSHAYFFYHDANLYTLGAQVASHDYSFSDQSIGGVNPASVNDTTVEASTLYVQSFNGLGARVALDTTCLGDIKRRAAQKGFTSVAVHKAIVKWKVKGQNADNYNDSFARLGLYYSFEKASFIADYNPHFTDQYGEDLNPMGGLLNRSTGYYSQDITSTIQKMLSGKTQSNVVELLPHWDETKYAFRSILYGSASNVEDNPQIIITYTLLR